MLDPSGGAGEGKAGRVNVSEPPMTSRQSEPWVDGSGTGVEDWSLESGRRRPVGTLPVVWTPSFPGYRRHPPRPGLVHVERGNPVLVRRVWPVIAAVRP